MAKSNFNDLNLIRRKNQLAVLSLLRKERQSCVTLKNSLNISSVAIYSIIDDLLEKKLIKIESDQSAKIGRKPALYSLNAEFGFFAAVDFSQRFITAYLLDIFGNIVAQKSANNKTLLDKSDIFNLVHILQELVDEYCSEQSPLRCICVATPGRIKKDTGYFWIAARFINPTEINMEEIFRETFDCPIVVKNDITISSIGINTYPSIAHIPNALLVHIGEGLGAALFLEGKNYEGENNAAGEFGSMMLLNHKGITSQFAISYVLEKYSPDNPISEEEFCRIYKNGDPRAEELMDEYISMLSVFINNILVILDISTVILSGSICSFGEKFLNRLQDNYLHSSHFLTQPRCIFSPLGDNAILVGCMETAFNTCISQILEEVL